MTIPLMVELHTVTILILVDFPLQLEKQLNYEKAMDNRNPCFSGLFLAIYFRYLVSDFFDYVAILVLVDFSLQ